MYQILDVLELTLLHISFIIALLPFDQQPHYHFLKKKMINFDATFQSKMDMHYSFEFEQIKDEFSSSYNFTQMSQQSLEKQIIVRYKDKLIFTTVASNRATVFFQNDGYNKTQLVIQESDGKGGISHKEYTFANGMIM